ncbi:MAG: hypothetical protein VW397_09020 [Candidatus Margulisiibacteriota bacterium]
MIKPTFQEIKNVFYKKKENKIIKLDKLNFPKKVSGATTTFIYQNKFFLWELLGKHQNQIL